MAEFNPDAYLEKKKKSGFDPDEYLTSKEPKDKSATDVVKDFGKTTASLADTGINLATGTLDYLAYPFARGYYGTVGGLNAEQAAAKAQQETTSPKDVIGRSLNITQDPAYQNEASRRLMSGVGETVNEYAVQPLTQATGLPEQDIANMVNTGMLAVPGAAKTVARPVINAGGKVINAAGDFTTGASGRLTNAIPKPGATAEIWQTPSARQPATETYTTAEQLKAWREGQIPTKQVEQIPYTPEQIKALQRTQGNVPLDNKTWQALGEQFGDKLKSPMSWLPELGYGLGAGVLGGPMVGGVAGLGSLAYKGYKALQGAKDINASKQLGNLGFTPMSVEEAAALRSNKPHPVAGPVTPTPTYNIPTTVPSVAGAGRGVVNPAQISQQAAAAKINPPAQPTVSAPISPEGISTQTQQRWNQTPGYTPPKVEPTTPASPVRSARDLLQQLREAEARGEAFGGKPKTQAQLEREQKQMAAESMKASNEAAIDAHMNGKPISETTPIDIGSSAYNDSNVTKGQAKQLSKSGYDSIPVIPGMTEAQVIDAMFKRVVGSRQKAPAPTVQTTPQTLPSSEINKQLKTVDREMSDLHEANVGRVDPNTPAGEKYRNQLGDVYKKYQELKQQYEAALKIEKDAEKAAKKQAKKANQ